MCGGSNLHDSNYSFKNAQPKQKKRKQNSGGVEGWKPIYIAWMNGLSSLEYIDNWSTEVSDVMFGHILHIKRQENLGI